MSKDIVVYSSMTKKVLTVLRNPPKKISKFLEEYCIANKKALGGWGLTLEDSLLSVLFGYHFKGAKIKKALLRDFPNEGLFLFCPLDKNQESDSETHIDSISGVAWKIVEEK